MTDLNAVEQLVRSLSNVGLVVHLSSYVALFVLSCPYFHLTKRLTETNSLAACRVYHGGQFLPVCLLLETLKRVV